MKHFLHTLGVDEDATWPQIREGYKRQMKVWHPDRYLDEPKLHAKAEERTKEIHYALRRLQELKEDIADEFIDTEPFLKQYAEKTNGGKGSHGKATYEDRRMGYLAESFGNWATVTSNLSDSLHRGARVLCDAAVRSRRATVRKRRRTVITTIHEEPKVSAKTASLSFVAAAATIILSTIGAYNILQLFPEEQYATDYESEITRTAERELLQMMLSEPQPNYEKNLDERSRLALMQQRSTEERAEILNAAIECDRKKVETLIRQGKDLDVQDSSGQTPLIWAAKRNCPAVVRLLLERGASSALRSTNGFTAHRWATWYRAEDALRVMEQLKVSS